MTNKRTKISEEFTPEVMDSALVINHLLQRIINLEKKIKKIEDLEQEIFELKTRNYCFNRSMNWLAFSIFCLTLPILFDISVKIVKLFA